MKNFKKALALLLVIVLTASITLGVTLALLTDETEIKHNVFTAGNVKIDLTEKVDGDTYGGVTSDEEGGEYLLVAPGDELTKEVNVKNAGTLPAYVAVTVTVNNAEKINNVIDVVYEKAPYNYDEAQIQAIYDQIFENWGLRYDKKDDEGNALGMRLTNQLPTDSTLLRVDSTKTTAAGDYFFYAYDNWFQSEAEKANTGYGLPVGNGGYYADDMGTYEWNYTYYLYLEPGQDYTLFTGINVPEYFTTEQMVMFDGLEIDIQGAAIQAENFADAKEAFTALRAEQDGNGLQPTVPEAVPEGATVISSAADLLALSGTRVNGAIYLANDIDMEGAVFAPMYVYEATAGANVTFIGNGYTISNINLSSAHIENGMNNRGLFHVGEGSYGSAGNSLTVRNLTIENATIDSTGTGYSDAGIVVGYINNKNSVTLTNVDVVNGSIANTAGNAGLLVGYVCNSTLNISDCDVSGNVAGERADKTGAYVGTATGAAATVTVTGCTNGTSAPEYGRVINDAAWN